jgi:hypothetical protein
MTGAFRGNRCVECLPASGDAGVQGCTGQQVCLVGVCR